MAQLAHSDQLVRVPPNLSYGELSENVLEAGTITTLYLPQLPARTAHSIYPPPFEWKMLPLRVICIRVFAISCKSPK